jgi:hypothetical protein
MRPSDGRPKPPARHRKLRDLAEGLVVTGELDH